MTIARIISCALLSVLVTGCGSHQDDPAAFVARVKARAPQPVEAIPEIASYQPYSYKADGRRGPFTPTRRETAATHADNGPHPDLKRKPDPLERFPLDALHMVGTITSAGVIYALIDAPDQVVHRLKRGSHLGENYGEIDSISDQGVSITELVPNGTGGYTKRSASMSPSG
ncbi:MAG: pilus assembly protein PilP [Salinisphaera sp.]|jgi:type IV pilus assembly protein PilP|nr:pilus assembly protein PilP [Salinisphaera sp.]